MLEGMLDTRTLHTSHAATRALSETTELSA
jgi:hypothetical protein